MTLGASAIRLDWTLLGPGSARLTWSADSEVIELGTTYLGDGLGQLVQAALDLKIGSSATFASLVGEPVGHVILFGGAADCVYIQIVQFDNLLSELNRWQGGLLRWSARVEVAQAITEVQRMARSVVDEYGEETYQRLWGGIEFPTAKLAALQV